MNRSRHSATGSGQTLNGRKLFGQKNYLVKHSFNKNYLVKYKLIKHYLAKHKLIKHYLVKHKLMKHYWVKCDSTHLYSERFPSHFHWSQMLKPAPFPSTPCGSGPIAATTTSTKSTIYTKLDHSNNKIYLHVYLIL